MSAASARPRRLGRTRAGQVVLAFALVSTAAGSVAVDWNRSHLFNPDWPPHARFHDGVLLCFLSGMCGVGLWLLLRRSAEPRVGAAAAALVPVLYWLPFFVVPWAAPGASLAATPADDPPRVLGVPLYVNAVIAAAEVAVAATGYWLMAGARSRTVEAPTPPEVT